MTKKPLKPVIGIIGGKGKMGQYFADLFTNAGLKVLISDVHTRLKNKQVAAQADIVIISVPIDKTEKVIKEVAPLVRRSALLADLTSLKEFPVKAMKKAKGEVVGFHPMFGHTNPIAGQTIIACPVKAKKWYAWLKKFLEERDAKVIAISPQKHDELMAVVQALVHFADIAFGHTLSKLKIPVSEYLRFAGPASELKIAFSARLLAQDPRLYGLIQLKNDQALKVLKKYMKSIQDLISITEKGKIRKFEKYFDTASKGLDEYLDKAFDDTNYLIHSLLYRRILESEKETKIKKKYDLAVLGPESTHTDLASQEYEIIIKKELDKIYASSIPDIFEFVASGLAKQGIVPVENLLHGSIRDTFDGLFGRNVHISFKYKYGIKHSLVVLPGIDKEDIRIIASHEQALQQCRRYLRKHFPDTKREKYSSTIAALETVAGQNERSTAVIVPAQVGDYLEKNSNGEVIAANIEDEKTNYTMFVVIEKGPYKKEKTVQKGKRYETSIAFYFGKDKPGSLKEIFTIFAEENINLTRIESRPSRENLGNFIFFLDFDGKAEDQNPAAALKRVRKVVKKMKILGSCPVV
ncbi:prephenate dehydratase [Pseudomonadota bacterium]